MLATSLLPRPSAAQEGLRTPEGQPAAPDTTIRLVVAWQWGDDAARGPSVRAQVFQRVVFDGRPNFYDLGGELAWEASGPRLSLGTRHKMYFVQDARFEQSVLLGVAYPWAFGTTDEARSAARGVRLVLSGSFGAQLPIDASRGSRMAPGVHLTWQFGTRASALQVEQGLGVALSWAHLLP